MNYCKFYEKHRGEVVKVTMTDDEVFRGELFGYISEEENEPERESIVVGRTELYTDEIAHIETENT